MSVRHFSFCLSLILLVASPGFGSGTRKAGLTVPVKYEGGTLPWNQGKLKTTIAEDELVFTHGAQRIAVPIKNITAISCGEDARRRFGASVLGMVPLMHLDKSEAYYIGVTWTGNARAGEKASKVEAVFRLNNAEYRDFLAVLERLTGLKAVNAAKVPTVVQYEL